MGYENNDKRQESVYSKRIKAGKRRTYFFDVRATRANDYFLTITESRKRFNDDGYDRHKIFLYKEDFNKFVKGLSETVEYVKTELMPDFDFDAFNHEYPEGDDSEGFNGNENGNGAREYKKQEEEEVQPVHIEKEEATIPVENEIVIIHDEVAEPMNEPVKEDQEEIKINNISTEEAEKW